MKEIIDFSSISDSDFGQQKLPAWRPIVTPRVTVIGLAILCVFSLVIGIVFTITNSRVIVYEERYDNKCIIGQLCNITFNVQEEMTGTIYLRFKLTDFYQNHRRFMESRSDEQLAGSYVDYSGMSACVPYRSVNDSALPANWLLPCGLSAASFFNDTYDWLSSAQIFSESGISWKSDRQYLYQPLSSEYKTGVRWLEKYTDFSGAQTNEHFIVWMRVSALSTVVKDYAICSNCVIKPGSYTVDIQDNYGTNGFNGEKYLILSSSSVLGSKNSFLGISYIVLGSIALVLCITLIIVEANWSRKPGDMALIKNILNQQK